MLKALYSSISKFVIILLAVLAQTPIFSYFSKFGEAKMEKEENGGRGRRKRGNKEK